MIGSLKGMVTAQQDGLLLVEVGGIGYEVAVPANCALSAPGERIELSTHLVIREDVHALYGFRHRQERDLFRILIRVNGVGPKLALGLLSAMGYEDLLQCMAASDTRALTQVPGIGPRTAQRLMVEMKDRIKDTDLGAGLPAGGSGATPAREQLPRDQATAALVSLGYRSQEALRVVSQVLSKDPGIGTEALVRQALQGLAKAGSAG